jgi:hypothetical protein
MDSRIAAGTDDAFEAVVPVDAVVRSVGFTENLEDLAVPLTRADAMPQDDEDVALLSGLSVHGGDVCHLVLPPGISPASRVREQPSSGQLRIRVRDSPY